MTAERRAQIIAQSLENLHRYKSSLAANGVSFDGREARSVDAFPDRAASSPPEDDVARWRREGQEFEAMRTAGRAQTRAEEEAHRAGQQEATDLFGNPSMRVSQQHSMPSAPS